MSAAVLVIYDGKPEDPERFLRYYIDVHVPLVWAFPGIRAVQIERTVEGDVFMIARFLFDTPAAARSALDSPECAVARADRDRFPAFHGTVRHQIVEILEIPRSQSGGSPSNCLQAGAAATAPLDPPFERGGV